MENGSWPAHWGHRASHAALPWRTALKEAAWFWGHHGPWARFLPRPKEHAPVVPRQRLPPLRPGQVRITWIGHATLVVQIGGRTILTDPVWSNTLPGGIKRLAPPGLAWKDLPPVDAVVLSHNHPDHMDGRTLRRLARDTPVFAPAGNGRWFRRRGFLDVAELDWWQARRLGGLELELVPAHHWSRRGLFDRNRALWGGWVVRDLAEGRSVYFAGDTGHGPCFRAIGERHPGLDVALLPVGAYAPRELSGAVHLDPEEAVRAFEDLGARRMVPMHWGTFRLSPEPVLEPIERTRVAWAAAGHDPQDLWELPIGGSRNLNPERRGRERGPSAPSLLASAPQARLPAAP